jgi:hypothetical protein
MRSTSPIWTFSVRSAVLTQIDDLSEAADPHFLQSTLRERIVEHVFVGELLRRLWQCGVTDAEVLRSEFDAGGYDLVVGRRKVLRHIQFKSSLKGGKTANVKVGLRLTEKPSGCVIWIVVTPDLVLDHFLWFGSGPDEPLPTLDSFRVAKHSKGNSQGVKLDRPNHRIVPRGSFIRLSGLDEVIERLFGPAILDGK